MFRPDPKPTKRIKKEVSFTNERSLLIKQLDSVFSIYIRTKYSNGTGRVKCFTCPEVYHWSEMDCGHFVSRRNMATRWEELNCRPQCKECNQKHSGNLEVFAENLDAEFYKYQNIMKHQTLSDFLLSMSKKIVKFSIPEIRELIEFYTKQNGRINRQGVSAK